MNYREIAKILLGEHPQTIAIALTRIPAQQAGEILKLLPSFMQADLLTRISQINDLPVEVIEEVDTLMAELLARYGQG